MEDNEKLHVNLHFEAQMGPLDLLLKQTRSKITYHADKIKLQDGEKNTPKGLKKCLRPLPALIS